MVRLHRRAVFRRTSQKYSIKHMTYVIDFHLIPWPLGLNALGKNSTSRKTSPTLESSPEIDPLADGSSAAPIVEKSEKPLEAISPKDAAGKPVEDSDSSAKMSSEPRHTTSAGYCAAD